MKRFRIAILCLAALVSLDLSFPGGVMTSKAKADEMAKQAAKEATKAPRAPVMPPPRDPAIAVAEEYEAARNKGTAEALELFIARHSDDPLAEKARADLKRLAR